MPAAARLAVAIIGLVLVLALIQVGATASWTAVIVVTTLATAGAVVAVQAARRKRWIVLASICVLAITITTGWIATHRPEPNCLGDGAVYGPGCPGPGLVAP